VSVDDNEFDLGKNIFQGRLVVIEDVPTSINASDMEMAEGDLVVMVDEKAMVVDEAYKHAK